MDKRIKKSKRANRRLTCGKGGHSHLIMLEQTGGEEEKEKKKVEREAPPLSSFSGDRTIGSHQSKKESSSSRQELQVETGIEEFQQTPRGRVFLLLGLILF